MGKKQEKTKKEILVGIVIVIILTIGISFFLIDYSKSDNGKNKLNYLQNKARAIELIKKEILETEKKIAERKYDLNLEIHSFNSERAKFNKTNFGKTYPELIPMEIKKIDIDNSIWKKETL